MAITLLGENIALVRPHSPVRSLIYKSERPYARHQARTKTVKQHCGRVVAVAIEYADGYTYSLSSGLPCDVIDAFDLDEERVVKAGWELENGNFLWR